MGNIFAEESTWEIPAELEDVDIDLRAGNKTSAIVVTRDEEDESIDYEFFADDFFNPIPPPSIYDKEKGLPTYD